MARSGGLGPRVDPHGARSARADGAAPPRPPRNAVGRPKHVLVRMCRPYQVKLQETCDEKANERGRGVLNAIDVTEKKNGS